MEAGLTEIAIRLGWQPLPGTKIARTAGTERESMFRLIALTSAAMMVMTSADVLADVIPYQYSSTLTAMDGTNHFAAGVPDASSLVVATLTGGNLLTSVTDNQIFSLGGVTGTDLVTPDLIQFHAGFKATISIIDGNSSASGMLTFTGTATASYDVPQPIDGPRTDFSYTVITAFNQHDDFLDFDHHHYDVQVTDDFQVTITPSDLPNAPEPTTLVSALVGIGIAITMRRRLHILLAAQ